MTEQAVTEMSQKIVDFVRGYQPVSYVELIRRMGETAKGDYNISLHNHPNIFIWTGVSELFADALNIAKHQLFEEPAHFLVYAMDGGMLDLPIATSLDHDEPHWLPSVLSILTEEKQREIAAAKRKYAKRRKTRAA